MYVLSAADELLPAIEPIRVGIVTVSPTAATQRVIAELRRAAIHVEVAAAEVLQAPPRLPVYVIGIDAASAGALAGRLVAWAAGAELQPGLIGLVEGGRVSDCETLLAAGFDDAAAALISPRELLGRVRAVHRRVHWKGGVDGRMRYGELTLDLHGRALWLDGKIVSLTLIEFRVLHELMKARGRTLSRTELLEVAWSVDELEVSERAVDNVLLRLRRKLRRPELIETVRGVGFRLAAPRP